jgi:hypothetical protein
MRVTPIITPPINKVQHTMLSSMARLLFSCTKRLTEVTLLGNSCGLNVAEAIGGVVYADISDNLITDQLARRPAVP